MSRIMKRWIALAVLLVFAVMGSAGACAAEQGGKAPAAGASVPEITDYSGLSGRTVSMLTGAPFEELVQQILMPALESPRIQTVIEYAEADARAMMTVRWSGPQTDLLACGNELSRSLLTGVTSGITYEGTRDDEFTNCLTLEFGEKT